MATEKEVNVNREITAAKVRLIGVEGDQLGIVSLFEALAAAESADLDLVEIAPQANPPVCRIMDYGKYRFQESKRQHEARRKQKQSQVKEIKFRPRTDDADYQIKLRNIVRFLEDGDRVKITLRFRGREMTHPELGMEVLNRVEKDLLEMGVVEQRPRMEGRQMVMVIAPRKK
ncbi:MULTISPECIES: translation initiation factor IF-3 [Acidithiobacillus]|uniref:translation initiation factor IF-3 n=1 Tax=Acidithiobacillus TaxID=119977 RepID=UPI0009837171|nr:MULTISPECIES: translation initiation factor IF-3 [Acidithiobacillus]AUW33587.1 translation initiation factor IF-3 [Acidithiobacillus caldus]MBU2729936.1 translation initiation factor IF-3 [Acidithiobacillus caldus]MBU2735279.1 translation initiation factor IF-3 [Acidithiobacillus caldus ATCC 51756]MBU2744884.1 translation initiation factor IF-3 [Acidithiobacillus caldus]MBU2762610.1 translation initiation factor IF-3 [Acidithiobacillus caldus]